MTETSDNKAVVLRHLEEAVSQRRPELWSELMADDFVIHHPLVGPGCRGQEVIVRVAGVSVVGGAVFGFGAGRVDAAVAGGWGGRGGVVQAAV